MNRRIVRPPSWKKSVKNKATKSSPNNLSISSSIPATRLTRRSQVKLDNPVLIDDRAGSKELIEYHPLDQYGRLTRLRSADVCIAGNGPEGDIVVGIEMKSITDLLSSCAQGRLQDTQVPAMKEDYDVLWLLHYGVYRPDNDGFLEILRGKRWSRYQIGARPVPYGYVIGLLNDLSYFGVNLWRVSHLSRLDCLRECAEWIGCQARWWNKRWKDHKGMNVFDKSGGVKAKGAVLRQLDPETYRKALFADAIDGIGYDRAVAAARYFPSVWEMVNASSKEWQQISGIGKTIADSAVRQIRKESM